MTQPTHRDEVYADDSIQKFQGRWIGPGGGWEWPVHARFVAWVIWFVVFPLTLLTDWLLTGSLSPLPLIDLIISFAITTVLANLTSGEVTLGHALVYAYRIARTVGGRLRRRISPPRPQLTRDTVKVSLRPALEPARKAAIEAPVPAVAPVSPPPAQLLPAPQQLSPAAAQGLPVSPVQAPVGATPGTTAHPRTQVHHPIPLPPPPPSPFAAPVGPVSHPTQPAAATVPPGVRPTGRASVPHQPYRWDQR